jgi:hypothetical protein
MNVRGGELAVNKKFAHFSGASIAAPRPGGAPPYGGNTPNGPYLRHVTWRTPGPEAVDCALSLYK